MEIYRTSRPRVARWIVFALFALIFAADLYMVQTNQIAFIDKPVMDYCLAIRDDTLTVIAKAITFLANSTTMIGLCLVLIILPTRTKFGLPLGIATGIAALCHSAVKLIVDRPRPNPAHWLVNVTDPSFPSGHANVGVVFYIFLLILLFRYFRINKSYGIAALVSIVLPIIVAAICASRLYLGVHYASDVIGGITMGACLLIIFLTLYEALWPIRWQITDAQPEWGNMRRRREWRHPHVKADEKDMVTFPSARKEWKRPNTTAKRREIENSKHPK